MYTVWSQLFVNGLSLSADLLEIAPDLTRVLGLTVRSHPGSRLSDYRITDGWVIVLKAGQLGRSMIDRPPIFTLESICEVAPVAIHITTVSSATIKYVS